MHFMTVTGEELIDLIKFIFASNAYTNNMQKRTSTLQYLTENIFSHIHIWGSSHPAHWGDGPCTPLVIHYQSNWFALCQYLAGWYKMQK